jgi:hypothetical protein
MQRFAITFLIGILVAFAVTAVQWVQARRIRRSTALLTAPQRLAIAREAAQARAKQRKKPHHQGATLISTVQSTPKVYPSEEHRSFGMLS